MEEIMAGVNELRQQLQEEQFIQESTLLKCQPAPTTEGMGLLTHCKCSSPRRCEKSVLIAFHSIKSGDKELTITSPLRQRSMSDRCDKDTTIRRTQGDSVLGETQKTHKLTEINQDDQFEDITMGEISNCINDNILDLKVEIQSSDEGEGDEQEDLQMDLSLHHLNSSISSNTNNNTNNPSSQSIHSHKNSPQHQHHHHRISHASTNNLNEHSNGNICGSDHIIDREQICSQNSHNHHNLSQNSHEQDQNKDSCQQHEQQHSTSSSLLSSPNRCHAHCDQQHQSKRDKILSIYAKATINSTENLQQMLIARAEMKTYNRGGQDYEEDGDEGGEEAEDGDEESKLKVEGNDDQDDKHLESSSSSSSSSSTSSSPAPSGDEESKNSSEQEDQFEVEKNAFIKHVTTRERIKSCAESAREKELKKRRQNQMMFSPQPKRLGVEQILANLRKESQESDDQYSQLPQMPSPLLLHCSPALSFEANDSNSSNITALNIGATTVDVTNGESIAGKMKMIKMQKAWTEEGMGGVRNNNNGIESSASGISSLVAPTVVPNQEEKSLDLQKIDENVDSARDSDSGCEDDTTANQSMRSRISTTHKNSYQEMGLQKEQQKQYSSAKNSTAHENKTTTHHSHLHGKNNQIMSIHEINEQLIANMKRGSCDAITGATAVAEYNHNHSLSSHQSAGISASEHMHHDYQTNKKSTFNTANAEKSKMEEAEMEGQKTDKEIKGGDEGIVKEKIEGIKELEQMEAQQQPQQLISFSQDKSYEMVFEVEQVVETKVAREDQRMEKKARSKREIGNNRGNVEEMSDSIEETKKQSIEEEHAKKSNQGETDNASDHHEVLSQQPQVEQDQSHQSSHSPSIVLKTTSGQQQQQLSRPYSKVSIDDYILQSQQHPKQSSDSNDQEQQPPLIAQSSCNLEQQNTRSSMVGRQRLMEKRRSMNLIVKVDQTRQYAKQSSFSHLQQKIAQNQSQRQSLQLPCLPDNLMLKSTGGVIIDDEDNHPADEDNDDGDNTNKHNNEDNNSNVCSEVIFDDNRMDKSNRIRMEISNNQTSLTPESNEGTPVKQMKKNRKASTDSNIAYLSEGKKSSKEKKDERNQEPCSPIQDVFPSSEAIEESEKRIPQEKELDEKHGQSSLKNQEDQSQANETQSMEVYLLDSDASIQHTPSQQPTPQHIQSKHSSSSSSQLKLSQRSFVSEQSISHTQSKFKQDYLTFLAFRPPYWEYFGISMIRDSLKKSIDSAKKAKLKVVFSNIGNCNSMYRITALKEELRGQVQVYSETTAAHLFFSSNKIKNGSTIFKCEPPIGPKENKEFLINASKLNMVDVVSSYHFPVESTYKCISDGDFRKAFSGICTAGCTLQATWSALYTSYKHSLTHSLRPIIPDSQSPEVDQLKKTYALLKYIANMLAYKPAKILNISSQKGSIAKGKHADFVVWDPFAQPHRVRIPSDYKFKEVHIFDKKKVYGQIYFTVLRGQVVYDASKQNVNKTTGRIVQQPCQLVQNKIIISKKEI